MTTKPKTRKVPAKPKKAPGEPKREASKILELIARWRWLEADQDYQIAIAPRGDDVYRRHDAEQERIIAKLRTSTPQYSDELTALCDRRNQGLRRATMRRGRHGHFDEYR
jgi:hypothetical protein